MPDITYLELWDYDGCAAHHFADEKNLKVSPPGQTLDPDLPAWLIGSNIGVFEEQIEEFKFARTQGNVKIIIESNSAREDKDTDDLNSYMQQHTQYGWVYQVPINLPKAGEPLDLSEKNLKISLDHNGQKIFRGGSFAPAMPVIQSYLQGQLGKEFEVTVETMAMGDIYAENGQLGQAYEDILGPLHKHQTADRKKTPRWVDDRNKISSTYFKIHRLAKKLDEKKSDDKIIVDVRDDHPEIIKALEKFFSYTYNDQTGKKVNLLPSNVTLRLYPYGAKKNRKTVTLAKEKPIIIQGTGGIDENYLWSTRYLGAKLQQSSKDSTMPITPQVVVYNYHIHPHKNTGGTAQHPPGDKDGHQYRVNMTQFLKFRDEFSIYKATHKKHVQEKEVIEPETGTQTTATQLCAQGLLPEWHDLTREENIKALKEKIAPYKLRQAAAPVIQAVKLSPITNFAQDIANILGNDCYEPIPIVARAPSRAKRIEKEIGTKENMQNYLNKIYKEGKITIQDYAGLVDKHFQLFIAIDDFNVAEAIKKIANDTKWNTQGFKLFSKNAAPKGIASIREVGLHVSVQAELTDIVNELAHTDKLKSKFYNAFGIRKNMTNDFYELVKTLQKHQENKNLCVTLVTAFTNKWGFELGSSLVKQPVKLGSKN